MTECVSAPTAATQRLSEHIPAVMNTYEKIAGRLVFYTVYVVSRKYVGLCNKIGSGFTYNVPSQFIICCQTVK
jgi:hypothetical protein